MILYWLPILILTLWTTGCSEEQSGTCVENDTRACQCANMMPGHQFCTTEGTFSEHFFIQLAECFGTPNTVRHPTLCLSSNIQGFGATFGTSPTPDVKNADYIIMSGANRAERGAVFTLSIPHPGQRAAA